MQAQVNLVKNPSFEVYDTCPNNGEQVSYSKFWSGIDSSWVFYTLPDPWCNPDYFNACATDAGATIPNNAYFYHYARTGNAMMGVRMFNNGLVDGALITSYLQGRLYTPLVAGQSYCVSFYVVKMAFAGYAQNNIGAYFDDGSIDTASICHNYQTEYTPQINDTAIVGDTLNWTKIQGSFIANGTERFITIGDFFDTANTEHFYCSSEGSGFYLVDDVSVIASNATAYAGPDVTITPGDTVWLGVDSNGAGMPCYWYVLGNPNTIDSGGTLVVAPDTTTTYVLSMNLCGTVTYDTVVVTVVGEGVRNVQMGQYKNVQIYPNPATTELTVSAANNIDNVSISNLLGQELFSKTYTTQKAVINVAYLPPGMYLIKTNGAVIKKFLKE